MLSFRMPSMKPFGSPRFRFLMAFTTLSIFTFASALDATLLGNALPTIANDLHASSLQAFWMSTSFLLAAVALQPAHTAFSDIFGRIPTLYVCTIIFTVGLLIFGTAKNATIVILGRTIQGVGGGGLEALSEVVLTDITTLKQRPLYLGIMSFFWAGAAVAGAPLGGVLAEDLSWRWLAWILLPFMGISLVMIPLFLTLEQDRSSAWEKAKRVDWLGIFLFICASALILFPITAGGQMKPWDDAEILAPLIIGGACAVLFIWVERKAKEPMLPPRIFCTRTVSAALFGAVMHGIATWGVLYYLPVYFQSVFEHGAIETSLDTLGFGLTAVPVAILTAFMIEIVRRYWWSVFGGWAFATGGLAALTVLSPRTRLVSARTLPIPAGIGLGMLYPSLAMPIQAGVDVNDVGTATGALVFMRNLGSTIGVAVGSSVFSNTFSDSFSRTGMSYSDFGIKDGKAAIDLISSLKKILDADPTLRPILGVYADAFQDICIFVAVAAGLGLLSSLLIKELQFESEDVGKQGFRGGQSQEELIRKPEGDFLV